MISNGWTPEALDDLPPDVQTDLYVAYQAGLIGPKVHQLGAYYVCAFINSMMNNMVALKVKRHKSREMESFEKLFGSVESRQENADDESVTLDWLQ
ncbi:MAG: hypothetical protein OXE50_16180 [Chloroflexi bacterium]|nr:hypothetical protein [Chloroflexota bacterium]